MRIKMKRKAQSISINTIVVAAIALIVLVVMIAIFTGRMKIVTGNIRDCATQKGQCKDKCLDSETIIPGTSCDDFTPKQYCCTELFSQKKTP
jgi:hypothetical protein